jgi:hypothetical protein
MRGLRAAWGNYWYGELLRRRVSRKGEVGLTGLVSRADRGVMTSRPRSSRAARPYLARRSREGAR